MCCLNLWCILKAISTQQTTNETQILEHHGSFEETETKKKSMKHFLMLSGSYHTLDSSEKYRQIYLSTSVFQMTDDEKKPQLYAWSQEGVIELEGRISSDTVQVQCTNYCILNKTRAYRPI